MWFIATFRMFGSHALAIGGSFVALSCVALIDFYTLNNHSTQWYPGDEDFLKHFHCLAHYRLLRRLKLRSQSWLSAAWFAARQLELKWMKEMDFCTAWCAVVDDNTHSAFCKFFTMFSFSFFSICVVFGVIVSGDYI